MCTAGFHFAGLTLVYSIAERNECYKTGKPELRYQLSHPGYLNRKYDCRPLSMFLQLYSGYHWRQVLFDSYSGLYKTYDSQGGKPPRDLWFALLCRIIKGTTFEVKKSKWLIMTRRNIKETTSKDFSIQYVHDGTAEINYCTTLLQNSSSLKGWSIVW